VRLKDCHLGDFAAFGRKVTAEQVIDDDGLDDVLFLQILLVFGHIAA